MNRRDFINKGGAVGLAGIGAASMSLQSFTNVPGPKSDTVFNVRDYGAKGDGKTPDSEAIQRALDAAGKVTGTVWFPAGFYPCHDLKVPANIMLKADPCWLYKCTGFGANLELDDQNATCVLDITEAYGTHIYGLVIVGDYDCPKPIHGIFLNNDKDFSPFENTIVIDDTEVRGFSGHGLYLKRVWLFIIRHSFFCLNRGDGVRLHGWDGFVTDNQFSANGGYGFGSEVCGSTAMFTANRVENNDKGGLFITNGEDWNITGNSFDGGDGPGLSVNWLRASTVTGNSFRRTGRSKEGLPDGERSSHVRLEACHGVTFTGNTFLAGEDALSDHKFFPQVGLTYKRLQFSIVSTNTFWNGFTEDMMDNREGGNRESVIKDNPGCHIE